MRGLLSRGNVGVTTTHVVILGLSSKTAPMLLSTTLRNVLFPDRKSVRAIAESMRGIWSGAVRASEQRPQMYDKYKLVRRAGTMIGDELATHKV